MSSTQNHDLYNTDRTGIYAVLLGTSVVIALLVLFVNGARNERYDNNDVIVTSVADKCIITKTSVVDNNVISSTAKVDCEKARIDNWEFDSVKNSKEKDTDSEFTVCLESEKYLQDCTDLELQHKMNTTKTIKSVSDLCEDKPKILFKVKDSLEVYEYEISCK